MNTQSAVIGRIESLPVEADEREYDRLPGMPLVGFFFGSVFSLALWAVAGWVAWQLMV